MKLGGSSTTTLSTIAVQAGQSQSTVSVLKSGSQVHLQLVQVHPGLCEIGMNQEENQKLIQEQQQLLEQLQKHEQEVVSVVEEKTRRRRRRSREDEEEEEVLQAMVASVKEGWTLLLHLLQRRQEVLVLAADFYRQALEFSVSIGHLEDLHMESNIITEVQLSFQSVRKDVLRKSLQLLTSSNILLQKLRDLQRVEDLQRRGGVLQEEMNTTDSQSSQFSSGLVLRLEQLVEEMQDRRRRADQEVRLLLQEFTESSPETTILDQDLQPGSTSEESRIREAAGKEEDSHHGEDHAHVTLLTNQRLQLMRSCDQQLEKVAILFQHSSSCEADETLRDLKESAGNMKQILDQTRTRTRTPVPPREPSRRLKALTEQLRRKITPGLPSPEDPVLMELQSLNKKIESNLELLQPYVRFLRTAQQVEEDLEELKEVYKQRTEEEPGGSRREVEVYWEETLQQFLVCQELGNNFVQTLPAVMVATVQQILERLNTTKQEVSTLRTRHHIQIQQQYESRRKYRQRLHKILEDLNCVSEMLDSCSMIDLGSDPQTSWLLESFSRAGPHFTRLDAEVEVLVKGWGALRWVQDRLEVEDQAVKEEDLSELLKLQQRVKNKIQQSQQILDLSSRFHLTTNQLEELLQSDPVTGPAGSRGSRKDQIQDLLKTASRLRTAVCTAVAHADWTRFRLDQLEPRLRSLDHLGVSWLKEATRHEERDRLSRLLSGDIIQLQDSFKELKKRFSNLRFNFLKRNDRNRNSKAARNQLQQVELHEEKLQALRRRLQGVTSRLGSAVMDRGVAREMEDAVNELQRQTGDLERSVNEHRRTLELSCRLQRAVEEYQVWAEDAAGTIACVRKFSSKCRSSDAVAVLNRQLETFVWPTVPQQEDQIQQISELAVRVHGREDGRRYVEKTLSRHSNMVDAIRQLSQQLTELDAKLKEEEEEEEEEERKMTEEQQEVADMYELKETGHTPELTTTNRKSPFSQEAESRQQWYSQNLVTSFSLCGSLVEDVRRVHVIHSQSQPAATPPPFVIGLSFSDIQREFQRKETSCGSTRTPLENAPGGGLSQQQEVMTDDSLSNGEYDCVSPDDISLPPLADTPESIMVQSDVEEAVCSSSYSIHVHQYHQSELSGSGSGVFRQKRVSSQTTPTSRHSSSMFRSESRSLVQSPLTVPASSILTSSPKTSTTNTPQGPRSSSESNQVHQSSTPDSNDVPETRSSSHHQPQSSGLQGNVVVNGPDPDLDHDENRTTTCQVHQDRTSSRTRMETVKPDRDTQTSSSEGPSSQRETFPQDLVHQCPSLVDLHQDRTQDPGLLKYFQKTTTLHQDGPPSRSDLDQDAPRPGIFSADQTGSSPSNHTSAPSPEPQAPIHPSSSITSSKKHQTSTSTQQCVHDLGMTTSSSATPAAPPQPQIPALANLHVTPPTSPPHLLTPDQDPDLCRPVAVREEIRITPQILGPPLPAPSPPQASQPGPPCFTRPLSRATVMEGSLVTLEMEVMVQPEPALTWCNRGNGEDGENFLSDPEASDSDGDDAWLVMEVCDIISEDWTWLGSLCVLLVLVYLVLL